MKKEKKKKMEDDVASGWDHTNIYDVWFWLAGSQSVRDGRWIDTCVPQEKEKIKVFSLFQLPLLDNSIHHTQKKEILLRGAYLI